MERSRSAEWRGKSTPAQQRLSPTRFQATSAVQGAWNTDEQHSAPGLGLLTHAVEQDRDNRRGADLLATRLSFDILGTLPIDTVDIDVRVIRPGRAIELVEATVAHDGRAAVILRACCRRPVTPRRPPAPICPRCRRSTISPMIKPSSPGTVGSSALLDPAWGDTTNWHAVYGTRCRP